LIPRGGFSADPEVGLSLPDEFGMEEPRDGTLRVKSESIGSDNGVFARVERPRIAVFRANGGTRNDSRNSSISINDPAASGFPDTGQTLIAQSAELVSLPRMFQPPAD